MSLLKNLGLSTLLVAGLALVAPSFGTAQTLLPEKRFLMTRDADLPGGDIASLFDTTLEACQKACVSNTSCTAITFNSRNGSCFLKSNPDAPADYAGAFSGQVVQTPAWATDLAKTRAADLTFLRPADFDAALTQAAGLGVLHITGPWSAAEHLDAAANADGRGDPRAASAYLGAALNITDAAVDWAEYARLLAAAANTDSTAKTDLQQRAFLATLNGYLRADTAGLRHSLLAEMAGLLETAGRGRDMVPALRLAQEIQARSDTEIALDTAIGKYGFRVTEHEVQSDSARPRICATFSDTLAKTGVDFEKFVQMDQSGLTVERAGDQMLCVEGVTHGERNSLTFRAGIPAADGQVTVKPVTITAYVRDRTPAVRFAGRAYILPKLGDGAALPVDSVNAATVDLTLYRITDRNILRAIQGDFFGDPMPYWREDEFTRGVGAKIWNGTADLAVEVNKDMTTRLPMDKALVGQGAGIFALRAQVQGKSGDEIAPAWQWFVVSDLGITTLSGIDGLHVVVRSLGTAGPKPGVTVELLSRSNEVLGTVETDAQGYAMFPAALARGTGGLAPAMVVAKDSADDMAFLSLTDPEFDLSDRGVEGREPAPPIDVFLTTDRGAYRAGETVYATALSRDAQAAAIEGLPLTAIVKRPDGVEYSRAQATDAGAGGHVFALPIAGSAPRGQWRLELRADLDAAPLAAQTFLIEDFLPERIDFTLTLPDTPIRLGDRPDMTVDVKYLFGAPGADLAIEGDVILRAATGLIAFPGYQFGRADEPFSTRIEGFGGMTTDAAGRAVVPLTMADVADPARPLELVVVTRIAEGSGRPVERRTTRALQPAAAMIGVKPMFDGVVKESSDAQFALLAVGPDEVHVAMPVKWELSRIETRYQWYQEYGNWSWEPVSSRERVADGVADLGSDPLQIASPVTWGQYELVVDQVGGAASTSVQFYAGWYAPADVTSTPDTLDLSLDQPAYRPGDTAQLRIVPRAAGTALISVLSNRLVTMKMVEVTVGENIIPLDVTADWGAGVYVTASVLRPMDVAAGRNPARAMGLAHASIDPGDKALAAVIEVAAEVAPRGPMDVAVKVDGLVAGDTAYATIAAVDVGILNLTSFKSPDPKGHYFGQRKLGVGIRDVYGRLIDGLNGTAGTVRSGGDNAAQARLEAPPPTEELVAYFTGPVTVGADGYARATFDMPSFNGTVRVMAVVWSKRGVGQAQADVLVRDPVVVTASVPRFMAPGDDSRILLEIIHATGPEGRMGLDITAKGVTLGAVPSGFDLTDQSKAVFSIPVTAGAEGVQSVAIALTTPDGKQLTKTLQIPVQRNDPEVARTTRLDLAPGQTFTLDQAAFDGFAPGSGLATMAIGPIARLDAPGLLAALDRYPYGCTEQITSRALPLIYFDQVAQAMQLKGADNISTRITQAVAEVLTNQSSEGGFGLWGPSQGDAWLDAYVTDFLSRARAQGYTVPDIAFRSALDNLRNRVNYTADFDEGGEALAYALMVLAREGAAAIGDLRYYADVKADAFSTPIAQAQLGAALASYGDQRRADAMFTKAGARIAANTSFNDAQIYRTDYGSTRRDAAAVLTLAVESGSNALDRDALAVALRPNGRTLSTQEATWTLLAANALIDGPGADGITLNGATIDGPLVRVLKAGDPQTVAVANGSDKPATLTLTTYGVPDVPGPAGGNGYAITRSYFTEDGTPVSLENGVTAGARYVVVLEVVPFGNAEARLMVADPLPAGFEIDNPNLLRGGDIGGFDWLDVQNDVAHSEFRQDRFLTAVDWSGGDTLRLAYVVRAVSPGSFHHPAASVEDMYRPDYRAQTGAGGVVIAE